MADTRFEFVRVLLTKPANHARDSLMERAVRGDFHDFKSQLDFPKRELVTALQAAGYDDLAQRAMDGEWDETPDEQDRAELGRIQADLVREDPDGASMLEQLLERWESLSPEERERFGDMLDSIGPKPILPQQIRPANRAERRRARRS